MLTLPWSAGTTSTYDIVYLTPTKYNTIFHNSNATFRRSAGPAYTFCRPTVGWAHFYNHLYLSGEPDVRQFLTEWSDKQGVLRKQVHRSQCE
jgi:hypothetical protein